MITARATPWSEFSGAVTMRDLWANRDTELKSGAEWSFWAVAIDRTGRFLTAGGGSRALRVWYLRRQDAADNYFEFNPQALPKPILSVDIHPTDRLIAAGCRGGVLKLYRLDNPRPDGMVPIERRFDGIAGDVTCVQFSPDGRLLASASTDGLVRFWDDDGKVTQTIRPAAGPVNWLSFSPDGRLLATAQDDGTVKLWKAETGQELKSLKDHEGAVLGLAFSRDGLRLATCGRDFTVMVYDLYPAAPDPQVAPRPKKRGG